ncbi:hypothetical protein AAV94_11610 [Lampropedia cohaerens]|uniref:Glycosyl transferase n=1 Tax=Lampropedia cohaerens TaxID=1610491 RepID=A0A0U1PXI0_9BURK|nr:glycosyltransferase family 4 protein [Lampropedia cohaerens]KKW67229.1 hypothetical protein AAV94_11610 [Lampropedia cohaerens]
MKILYIITQSESIGGASLHLLDLAEGIQQRGHQVLLAAGGAGLLAQHARKRELLYLPLTSLVRDISIAKDIKAVGELTALIRREKPDIVHLHSSKAGVIGRIAAKLTRTPCVFTAHGWAFTEGISPRKRQLYRLIEKYCAGLAQRIITVSNYDRHLAIDLKVAPPQKLITIHNGVHDTPIRRQPIILLPGDAPIRFIMVARFQAPKQQMALIQALTSSNLDDWQLSLPGAGPLLNTAQMLAREVDREQRVSFPGECNDIAQRLADADVFVLISAWEGLPLSIIEAMRAGLPVVASDVGGVRELVVHGETGLLVPRGDQGSLRQALETLGRDAALRRKMGQAARLRYEQHFAFEPMLEKTLQVYQDSLRLPQ